MYFVGLPEWENMTYVMRVQALRHLFGQETDTSISLQELVGLKRGKTRSAKELADSARQQCKSGTSHVPGGSRQAAPVEVRRTGVLNPGNGSGKIVEIHL